MVNPAVPISQQFYEALAEDLPNAWNDDDYNLLANHYETTQRQDPGFKFPKFEKLIEMRKDKNRKYTPNFKQLKEEIQTIVKSILKH